LRRLTRAAALKQQWLSQKAARARTTGLPHPESRLAYRAAHTKHQKDYYEKQLMALEPVKGRFFAWCIGFGLGTAISMADGFMGFFNGKNLVLSAPILWSTLLGYFIPHITISIVFPAWILIAAGLCIGMSVFLAQMVLTRPPAERIMLNINEKAQKGLGRITLRNIAKAALVVPVVFISSTGAGLFVAAAVSTLFPPSAIAMAFVIGGFILLEIIAFRGTRLYDEMSFLFRVASGRDVIPWHDLTGYQKFKAFWLGA
jgi:hypothetical protein